MAVSMSGRDLFMTHSSFTSIEWNSVAFSSINLYAPSATPNSLLVYGDVTPLEMSDPNDWFASFM